MIDNDQIDVGLLVDAAENILACLQYLDIEPKPAEQGGEGLGTEALRVAEKHLWPGVTFSRGRFFREAAAQYLDNPRCSSMTGWTWDPQE